MTRTNPGELSNHELGAFLRSRRDRLTPRDVGLPCGPRRRVPGLRREEVAVLAHVGTTWYTWLEQGREVHASVDVLTAIADALLLEPEERAHLFRLGGYPAQAQRPGTSIIDDRLRAMLNKAMPYPAMVHDELYRWRVYNPAFRFLIDDADEAADRSCVHQLLENRAWQNAFRNDPEQLRIFVAKLRASFGESPEHPDWSEHLNRLRTHEEFRRLWDSGDVVREANHIKTVDNPWVGTLRLSNLTLVVQEDRRLALSIHQPEDSTTAARLEHLQELIHTGQIERAQGHRVPPGPDEDVVRRLPLRSVG
ncbi:MULTISPECIES: helix-turn-helix transcriptional regulator [Micrococcaceae]|uniref:helix-turn-helix transcriptional regulator n=1 Tax=unclassified Kocuria TaxID=2649579 RepID=UPI001013B357|nr:MULTISPECIES: helix-turn-helix transcriptional regulator [unclassified Kocuria]